jgi:Phage ABA sandwich domain
MADEFGAAVLAAGRELDALVAEKVMGLAWEKVTHTMGWAVTVDGSREPITRDEWELRRNGQPIIVSGPLMHGLYACPVPGYSTDIAAAWEVVEKLDAGWFFQVERIDGDYHEPTGYREPGRKARWAASFQRWRTSIPFSAVANSVPEAICRAALKAVGA